MILSFVVVQNLLAAQSSVNRHKLCNTIPP